MLYRLLIVAFLSISIASSFPVLSQPTAAITGVVTELINDQKVPLIGATVWEKGTGRGTVTDVQGKFSLIVDKNATLVISMIGYEKAEVVVGAQTTLDIVLTMEDVTLKEVVVTGYQSVDKKLFTGSTVSLKGSDVKQDGLADVSRMLQGKAAGVSVQNVSGTFGTAPKIKIRGATSITGDNKPLWVVDGIVLEDVVNMTNEQLTTGDTKTLIGSSIAGLSPDDIESVQILKDASATAQYGARAMNGVVVVTTKRGRVGAPTISYTKNFSTYLVPSYRQFNIMNSADQMSVYMELERKGWLPFGNSKRMADGGVYAKMYDLIDQYDPETGTYGLENTPQARHDFLLRYAGENTNWFDVLFKNSLVQEHALSVSSGTDKSQVYFSGSYYHDNGWTVADNVTRLTGNARANFKATDRLSFGLSSQGSIRQQQAPGTVSRKANPVEGKFDRDFDINPFSYALNTGRTLTAYTESGEQEFFRRNFAPFNILHELKNNFIELQVVDLKFIGEGNYKITPELTLSVMGSARFVKSNRAHKVKDKANMAEAYRADDDAVVRQANRFLYRDPDNPEAEPVVVLPYGGFYNTVDDDLVSYNTRSSLDWNKKINDTHLIRALATQELRYVDRKNKFNYGYGYQFDKGGVPYVDPRMIKQIIEGNFDFYGMSMSYERFLAYMLSGSYSYKGKYNISLTSRYDGSNLLGESRRARWLPTWNVSGSWNVDTEEFFASQSLMDLLTVRATYGLTASMGSATNSSVVFYSGKTNRPYFPEIESVIRIDDLENRNLTWEKQYEANVGLDMGFFGSRIGVSTDVYTRNAFDLISPMRTSGIGGQYIKYANYADMKSKGFELTLNTVPYRSQRIEIRSQFTFSISKNEITNLAGDQMIWSLVAPEGGPKKGFPYRGLFSLQFDGLDSETGAPTFIDENGEHNYNVYLQSDNTAHLKYEGPVDPPLSAGWSHTIRYRSLTVSVLLTACAGNKVRLAPVFNNYYSDLVATPVEFNRRWITSGDEQTTTIPSIIDVYNVSRLNGANPYALYNYSTERVAKGDFIRLKQVSLNWSVPAAVAARLRSKSMSVILSANNVALLYSDRKLQGQDPEFFGAGGVALPVPRQYTLTIKAGF